MDQQDRPHQQQAIGQTDVTPVEQTGFGHELRRNLAKNGDILRHPDPDDHETGPGTDGRQHRSGEPVAVADVLEDEDQPEKPQRDEPGPLEGLEGLFEAIVRVVGEQVRERPADDRDHDDRQRGRPGLAAVPVGEVDDAGGDGASQDEQAVAEE